MQRAQNLQPPGADGQPQRQGPGSVECRGAQGGPAACAHHRRTAQPPRPRQAPRAAMRQGQHGPGRGRGHPQHGQRAQDQERPAGPGAGAQDRRTSPGRQQPGRDDHRGQVQAQHDLRPDQGVAAQAAHPGHAAHHRQHHQRRQPRRPLPRALPGQGVAVRQGAVEQRRVAAGMRSIASAGRMQPGECQRGHRHPGAQPRSQGRSIAEVAHQGPREQCAGRRGRERRPGPGSAGDSAGAHGARCQRHHQGQRDGTDHEARAAQCMAPAGRHGHRDQRGCREQEHAPTGRTGTPAIEQHRPRPEGEEPQRQQRLAMHHRGSVRLRQAGQADPAGQQQGPGERAGPGQTHTRISAQRTHAGGLHRARREGWH
mmetsp:Transcript_4933/g.17713  ORF Transcript_4933/g.17713 Transcript_4933/m.17713 type:complete len:370 (+) Transcript_4933:3317-4426(+)